MARRSKKQQHHGSRQNAPHRGDSGRPTNLFEVLPAADSRIDEEGEMNEYLVERFRNAPPRANDDFYVGPQHAFSHRTNLIRDYFNAADALSGKEWLEKPEIPTSAEILPERGDWDAPTRWDAPTPMIALDDDEGGLRPNKTEGAYDSKDDYLRTQYNLTREDALRPLRNAVEQVRSSPYLDESEYQDKSIGLYEPVYITALVFSGRGLATRVAFSLSRVKKHVRWEQSKRLVTGTLVALSPMDDCFQRTCVLATVAARPVDALHQNPPEIDLFFARPEDMEVDPMKKFIMVECRSSFFEASRHTLTALQHMSTEPFPLSEHIVDVQKEVKPPHYVEKNNFADMSPIVAIEEADSFRNVNVLSEWPSKLAHGLDVSQSKALKRILTSRLSIVQGPPGTGKTYVSVVALKILLANMNSQSDAPIIVTCQTNHALDQLLRHIAEFEPNFIRLGGRSKDKDLIKKRTLFEVRQTIKQPPKPALGQSIRALKSLTTAMQSLLAPLERKDGLLDHRMLAKIGLLTEKQVESLEDISAMGLAPGTPGIEMEQWMGKCLMPCLRPLQPEDFMEHEEEDFEIEILQELEAEAVAQDDDIEALKGPSILLSDNVTGTGGSRLKTDNQIRKCLSETDDMSTIPTSDRGAVYNYLQRQTKKYLRDEFRRLASQYEGLVRQRRIAQWEQDHNVLSAQRLIGMTTTGLSKYRALISALKPKIVLVEEAAETLEAPVAVACLPSLDHLVLVGDHQQLRPHCQSQDFQDEPYNFNYSLFERMVINEIDMSCLTRQRRMIPEIRRLLAPIYANTLKDHPSVKDQDNRPPVEGMGGNDSFFFTHEWQERQDVYMSFINEKEADMIAGFFNHLYLNGVNPSKITVLTFYNGQRKEIIKRLRRNPNLQNQSVLNVATVDSYQGEENDIVLLSLVRSNTKSKIGFLSVDNRVCVALSRAKRGFYLFGNAEILAIESDTWAEVVETMYGKRANDNPKTGQKRRVGYCFPLICSKHGNKAWVQEPSDWDFVNGGCDVKCDCILPCGHRCLLFCHPFPSSDINCTQKCLKRIESCGHPCSALCSEPCRCVFCERNQGGSRAMLRGKTASAPRMTQNMLPMPQHTAKAMAKWPSTAPQNKPESPVIDPFGGGYNEKVGSDLSDWDAYANGGARYDDAAYLEELRGNSAKLTSYTIRETRAGGGPSKTTSTKLIGVSPQEKQTATEYDGMLHEVNANVSSLSVADSNTTDTDSTPVTYAGKGKEKVADMTFDLIEWN